MTENAPGFRAACGTTAMGIMPHSDVEKALKLVLGLDIPFWPQLPNVSFYEDMYAQTSQNFPGITVAPEEGKVSFNSEKFETDLPDYSLRMADNDLFNLTESHIDCI